MNWLFIFVVLVIAFLGWIGYRRGLIKSVIGTFATILALVLSYALAPTVSRFLQDKTKLDEYVEEKVYSYIEQEVGKRIGDTVDTAKKSVEDAVKEKMKTNPDKQEQISLIRELGIPDFLEEKLLNNNNLEGYLALGVDNVYRYIARTAAIVATNAAAGVLTFLVIRLLLVLVNIFIGSLVHSIAVLRVLDKLGGAAAGMVLGVIAVWLVMFVMSVVMSAESYNSLLEENVILRWLDNTNVVMKIALGRE